MSQHFRTKSSSTLAHNDSCTVIAAKNRVGSAEQTRNIQSGIISVEPRGLAQQGLAQAPTNEVFPLTYADAKKN